MCWQTWPAPLFGRSPKNGWTARHSAAGAGGADIIAADICRGFEAEGRFVTAEVDVRDFDALRAAVDSGAEQGRLDVIVAWMPAAV